MKMKFGIGLIAALALLSGCANWDGYAGVENSWRAEDVPVWEVGVTTAADVAAFLGPPSQLIPIHDETVLEKLCRMAFGALLAAVSGQEPGKG